ncbi:hypothetical protein ABH930_007404 [Kitasatospora sp. GAS204A]|nr:hypothetical protein [Kitasatospora sp. GAS204B]
MRRAAARFAPDAGRWEVLCETRDESKWRDHLPTEHLRAGPPRPIRARTAPIIDLVAGRGELTAASVAGRPRRGVDRDVTGLLTLHQTPHNQRTRQPPAHTPTSVAVFSHTSDQSGVPPAAASNPSNPGQRHVRVRQRTHVSKTERWSLTQRQSPVTTATHSTTSLTSKPGPPPRKALPTLTITDTTARNRTADRGPTTGKTHQPCWRSAAPCHLVEAARNGPLPGQVPVAYLRVPPGASAKTLAPRIGEFSAAIPNLDQHVGPVSRAPAYVHARRRSGYVSGP